MVLLELALAQLHAVLEEAHGHGEGVVRDEARVDGAALALVHDPRADPLHRPVQRRYARGHNVHVDGQALPRRRRRRRAAARHCHVVAAAPRRKRRADLVRVVALLVVVVAVDVIPDPRQPVVLEELGHLQESAAELVALLARARESPRLLLMALALFGSASLTRGGSQLPAGPLRRRLRRRPARRACGRALLLQQDRQLCAQPVDFLRLPRQFPRLPHVAALGLGQSSNKGLLLRRAGILLRRCAGVKERPLRSGCLLRRRRRGWHLRGGLRRRRRGWPVKRRVRRRGRGGAR
mmetsp:Transcript_4414/g.8961  ORF Transcript_4414/g.8961 Transcript_4414/m.8961 type:complete len:294 (-) Transcript_4414:155-1036(-)